MASAFDFLFGFYQGRIQPTGHTPDPSDDGPAGIITGRSEPFALVDLDTFEIQVDGGATQSLQFNTADFASIGAATAAEIAAVLNTGLTGITADDQAGRVRILSNTAGTSSSLFVVDGTSLAALSFPSVQVTGYDGVFSMVLGYDSPGYTDEFQSGDKIEVSQAALINTDERSRLVGSVRWPTTTPAGYGWAVEFETNGYVERLLDPNVEYTFAGRAVAEDTVNDITLNTSSVVPTPTLIVRLVLTDQGGGAGTTVTAELPAVYLDAVQMDEDVADLTLANRYPAAGSINAPADLPEVKMTIVDTTASPVDLTATQVYLEGVLAYDGGAGGFQAPFTGTVTAGTGASSRDTAFVIDWSSAAFQPLASEQVIDVRVVSDTVATGSAIDTTYQFTVEDTTLPAVVGALARDQKIVRVTFNEPMDETSVEVALSYGFTTESAPAVSLTAVSVEQVSPTEADITVDLEMTQGAQYLLTVGPNVLDIAGNGVDPATATAAFLGFYCPRSAGRDFTIYNLFPALNRREDEAQALQAWSLCVQDIADLILCDIDKWTNIFDIDLAPEAFVDAILAHLGNPFNFPDISLIDRRRLGRVLVDIYKTKGTEPGIVNAIRFFTGVTVTLDVLNDRPFWQIGVSTLGVTTTIGPADGSPLWYSFYIVSPVVLTDEQRDRILTIATYMKAAHEHILGIVEPTTPVPPGSFWTLGVSELGVDTILSA